MKSLANNISTYRTILPRHVSKVLLLLFLLFDFSEAKAQAFCNNPLGSLAPNLNWQYVSHNALGYYTFNATAGCTYQFTYCSSFAPSASYSGDPYITISTGATSGAIVTNDDYCGLGSYLSWTAPSTGLYYFNVGNCCSPQCGSISTRTFGYRSTNCAGTTPSPTGITATATTICAGQSTTLTAQGAFGTQFWYTGSCGGSQVGTGGTLTVTPNTTTTYYVNNNSNGQFGANCATITITVNPAPVAPTVSGNAVFCGSASTTLTASGGANYYWYSNAAGTNQVATGPTFTTPVLNSTTTYYVSSGQIAPPVPGNPVTFNYTGGNQTYTVPAGVSALNVDIRGAGGGISGGIQGGQGGRITGTLPVMAGTTYNIIVGGAGQPRTYNRSASGGGGFSGVLQGTTHLISAGGGGGAAGDGAAGGPGGAGGAQNGVTAPCGNGGAAGVGGLSGGVGGNGITNGGNGSNTGGGNGGNGGNNRAAGGGGGGFGTNAGVGGAQATVGGQGGNGGFGGGGGGGGGGWGSTNARLSAGGGGGGGYAGGGGGSVGINCGSGGGGGGGGGSNYADPSVTSVSSTVGGGGSPGGNGQVIITPIGGGGGCPSQLTPVTITVNPSPTITVSGVTICSGQTATLTATTNMQGGTFSWSPGNLSGATINVAPNATTTYTVTYTLAGCGSVTASATVTVNQSPAAPSSSGVTLCGPGSTTLSATGGQNNNYTWYSNSNATGQLGTGPNFTTPTLSTTTTYYVGTMSQGGNTTGTQTFNYTGGPQSFTAPATGNYTFTLYGAQGGNGLNTTGGLGGQATGSLALTAGQTISVYVGGKGGNAGGVVGWNGGGQGGLDIGAGQHGGSGGGATDIRVGGTGLANRVIVAGGGAGGGRDGATGVGGGSSGTTSANFSSGYGGTGGTQAAGGVAWTLTRGATDGSLGQGGNGSTGYNSAGGGGGGGGYYGGGGGTSTQNHGSGWSAGGGGGSSYIGGVLGGSTTQGVQSNDGLCTISWNIAAVGCPSALTPVTVTVNPIPIITVNNATICAGQPATLTATSSVAGGSFAWSPGGQSGASITVSPNTNTTYTATYTLAGCPPTTGTGNITVTPLQPITGTLNACIGQSSQLANAVTPGSWVSSNQGVATINGTGLVSGLSPGTTTITYNANNGCSTTSQFVVNALPVTSTTQVNVLCFGNSTGSIDLTTTGGTSPYTYAWSNNTTQEDPTNLVAGTYSVTVTDANGCTAQTSVTITQPQVGLSLSTTQVNVLCYGNSTGSINLTATGGTSPYTYAWSNNTTQEDPTNLAAGTYSVTVTDANGCTAQTSVTITEPQAPLALSTTQVNVGCFGNSTGSVNLTVTGGTSPYTYLWSNNGTVEDPTGMASGTYSVTVTDANGCTSQTSVTITQPQAPLALSTTQVNVLCFGNSTGSIDLTTTGGTSPYTYAWSNNTTQEDPTNLAAGTYSVTVTDANGCTAQTSVTITQPQVGLSLSTTQVNVLCYGNSTGSINLTATGGTSPYTYAWSNNTTQEDPTNLAAGTYSVTVTDGNGCTAQTSVTITEPQAPLALSTTQVNVGCFGNSTGSVNLTVTGGTSPYTYLWSNNGTVEDPTGMASGTYSVTVTDANGCTSQTSVTITQPQAPLALSTTQVNVLCFGNSTGSIDLTTTGGTSPYTYAWSNNTTQEDPTNLVAGTYSVTVTDANGCTAQTSVTITQPQVGLSLSTTQVNVLCYGNSTGSINLTATGGTSPYTYAWSNNTTQEDPTNLTAGTYSVTVTDANGCTAQTSVTITEPQAPLALSTTQVNVGCFGNSTGSVNLTVTGGTSPYTYLWSNNGTVEDPTGMASGTYSVTVTDANGCTSQTSVTITQPQAPLALSTTQVNVLCFGNSTGSIDLTTTGGTSPYTYAWSNNTTQEDPTNLAAGTYSVTVTDANGCTAQTSATITQPQGGLSLSTTQVNVLCYGNSTGSINLTATGGTSPYTYAWSNNTTQEDPTNLTAGTYSVTVTDANGCTAQTSVTITEPQAPLALSTTQVNVGCFGNSTGSVNLTVTGGTSPYTYLWSNNGTVEDPTGMASGTYSVTVTDANGCTSQTSVTITQPQAPLALSTTQVNVLCFGNSTGSIDLTTTGGTSPYTYAWSNNTTQEDPTNLVAGTYSVTVTDANGCTAQTSVTITQPQGGLSLSTTQVNVLCYGNSTGSINLTATGGTSPYTYAWSNNTTQEDPTNLTAGTYSVTVTDANGCTAQTSVTITEPQAPLSLSTTQVNVGCFGNSTGSVNLTVTGGTSPYTYLWSNNGTAEDPTGMASGTYSVTVTDANGCTSQTSVTITQPQAPLALSTTQVNVLCFGNSTGSIDLTTTGGTSPYTYAWSNNTTQEDPTNLVAGTYSVTVTDANGCTAQTSVTITQPQVGLSLSTTQVNVLCYGNSTGSINLTATGGTSPYTYAWSNNTTQEDPTNLTAGTYSVTVTDANGCTAQTSVTITEPQAPLSLSTTQVNVGCFGNSTGSVNLTVTGGTSPYTYLWSNNGTAEDPTGMASGTYSVTVTDANGCTSQTSVTITQPQAPLALSTTQVNVLCFGNSTGSIDLTTTGGTSSYTYAWSNNTTQEDPTNLAAGTYSVTVTDANGCTAQTSVTITQPQVGLSLSTTQVNVLCYGNSTGSINLTVSGGTSPYTYAWSNNTTQEDPTNLTAGTYSVTVTDANGCTAQTSVTITEPQAPLALSTTQVNVGCFGNSTGSVNLTVTGGTSPYTYLWSNNGTVEDPTGMASGTYSVTVTDANGCTAQTSVTITQPQAQLALSTTQVNVLCFGNSTGSIDLTTTGGTSPYTYAWSNNTTQEDPTNLVAGTYSVTVTDANGCTAQTSVTITQPQGGLSLSTTQVNVLCYGNSTGSINLTATGGTSPYTYAWSNNTTQEDPTNLTAGTYSVTVTDANGCTAQTSVTITQPQAPLALSTTQVNVLCFGNSTGSVNLTVTGGTSPYTYAWSNNTTQEDPANLAAGTYSVTVTDANGCTSQTSVTITQPQGGLSLSATQINVLCFGNSTGSINLTVTGGTSPYTYAWSNNSTQEDLTNLSAGSYTVIVSDNSACTAQLTITITQPTTALSLSTMQVNVGCYGNSTGSINLTVSGGTSPYTYAWSNNTTQEDPTNLAAGTYSVTVTDANGCTSQTSVTITQPQAPLALSTTQVNVLCFGNSTGSINLTVTGGTSPYTYAWSNNTTQEDPANLAAGTYSVTVTDANGCTSQTSVTITQPQGGLSLSATQVNVLCFGNSTGSIDLTTTGGTSPYTYAWSNNTTQEDPTNLAAGTYSVTVTDANGCTSQTSVTITQPQAPLALSTTQVNVLCYGNSTGSINLTATGGTSPYTYAWSNNTTQEDPTNLAAGTYSVTVTDANGCTAQTTVSITQPSTALTASATAQNILCLNGTGSVTAQGNGAVAPYSYLWNNQATTQTVTGLLAGTYVATVMDANGCTVNVSATIVATLSPIPVQIINLTGTSILTCTTPSIQIQATGGVSYNWTGGITPLNDTNSFNAPGTYNVNLIDPNGCNVVQSVTITQNITPPIPAIINNTGTAVLDCNNASISLTATGGGNYNWNNNLGTSQQVNIVQAGSYTVVITAANGCQDSATILITLAPTPSITLGDTTICSGQNVTISPVFYPSGGQVIWSNGLTSQSITVSPATTSTYNVLYDWNGCTVSEDAVITVIPTPSVSVSNFTICFGDSVQINAVANIPNGDFLWTPGNQTSSSILVSPTTSTSYSVQYTLNGCISPVSTSVVTVTPLPTLSVPTITICNGQPGTLTANTNTPGGTYMWSQGSTSQTITESPQLSTSYQVVYNANGCYSDTATGLIIVNPLPQAMFTIDTTSGCVPVTVTLTADTSGQLATYTWNSNGATQTAGQTVQMTFSLGGCFDISLTATMNGCSTTSNSNDLVCVQDYPIAAFTSYPPVFTESSQTLNFTNNSLGASGYVWSFGEGSLSNQENPEHYFQSVGEGALVTLTASTTMGCMDSASLYIPADLGPVYYIPNSFTPDGDKYNQVFLPVFTAGVDLNDFSMVIYNRWGEIMFETLNPYVGWDGSYGTEGLDCPVGTYTYKIRIKIPETDERRIITGHVNLIK